MKFIILLLSLFILTSANFSSNDINLVIYKHNMFTIEEIISHTKAYDDYDGYVDVNLYNTKDNTYNENVDEGKYILYLEATDSSNNKSIVKIVIEVIDLDITDENIILIPLNLKIDDEVLKDILGILLDIKNDSIFSLDHNINTKIKGRYSLTSLVESSIYSFRVIVY